MMLEIIVFILILVVGIQSLFMYLLTNFFKNIIRVASEEKKYFKLKHDNASLPIDFKSVPGFYEEKKQKLSYFFKENNEVNFIFLSATCATCKDIINKYENLPLNVYFIFHDPSPLEVKQISILSPEAFNAFDIKTTPTLITLSTDNSIRQKEVYSMEDLQLQLSKNTQTKKSS